MALKFTIIDYTIDPDNPTETVVDEPVGWDGINLRLKRDPKWHGFFDFADDALTSLRFIGSGFDVLKTAYEAYGAAASVQLLVEYECADGDNFDELYRGRFVFSRYSAVCGDECYVEIGIEASNCFMMFRNRSDQKVDLDSLLPFDRQCTGDGPYDVNGNFESTGPGGPFIRIDSITGHTIDELNGLRPGDTITITGTVNNNGTFTVVQANESGGNYLITVEEALTDEGALDFTINGCIILAQLDEYDGLNRTIVLPSKKILVTSKWQANVPTSYDVFSGTLAWFTPNWTNVISEIQDTLVGGGAYIFYPIEGEEPYIPPDDLLNYHESLLRCSGPAEITIDISGSFSQAGIYVPITAEDGFKVLVVKATDFPFDVFFATEPTVGDGYTLLNATVLTNEDLEFSYSNVITGVNFEQGEKLFVYFWMGSNGIGPTLMNFNQTSYFKATINTQCENTSASGYMINETLSRITEAYTNDCMRVYSDYYGREDAQPYTSAEDGCGSRRAISNGLIIRNAPTADESPQRMTVSMKDMFEALNAVDNIGMGMEDDPNRANHKLIRVEPQEHFYNETVLMECASIRKISRKVDSKLIYSIVKTGYQKHETWNIDGLYDLFGQREYRTELSELKNELDLTCKFLASDYAIEITRRLYGSGTSDWRYDNDIFFLCLTNCWIGEVKFIETEGTYAIVFNIPLLNIESGDTITIEGAGANDGTYTVIGVGVAQGKFTVTVTESVTDADFIEGVTVCNEDRSLYIIEQGVDSPENISNPETVMNYRLAPSRNSMRWLKTILQSYRQYINARLVFTNGSGNLVGKGLVPEPCRLESGPITENQSFYLNAFEEPAANHPLFWPELVEFDYPMSYEQYLVCKDNPYGLVGFQCGDDTMEYGWIEDLQYSPYTGLVSFVLRPKIES